MKHLETDCGLLHVNAANADGVRSYKGIPYAAAPAGELRWRAPRPAPTWAGVGATDTFGANALQGIVFDDIDPYAAGVSEDCLYLNVWTPAEPGENARAPVLFWIHGGGFAVGSGAEPRYDGARLAARGIVVVTVNHRLNALGLLAHPALTRESEHRASGNFAMLDLVAALAWVKRNIARFGGDPRAVTIAGVSAGSMLVCSLMASPLAIGLFHRAIGQSGGQFPSPDKPMQTLAMAEAQGLAFAEKLGAKTAADLRALPAAAILEASPGLGFWPIVDGHFLPESPAAIFAKGHQNDVPLIAGWNRDEGFNFNLLSRAGGKVPYEALVEDIFAARASEALKHYPPATLEASARGLGGDLVINHGAWAWLEAQRAHGGAEIFRYRFDHAPKTPKGWFEENANAGAFHSCEIPYVLDTLDAMPWIYDEGDRQVSALASRYWLNFVKTGNPNGNGLPQWPSYRDTARPTLCIGAKTSIEDNPDAARHTFLAAVVAGASDDKG